MSICARTNLGNFSACEDIDINVQEEVFLKSLTTARECTYEDGFFGKLDKGMYIAITESQSYKFKVV